MPEPIHTDVSTTTKYLAVIFVLVGLVLVAVSIALEDGYLHELLKELGIVVLSVFTVSIIYERLVAEKYLSNLQQLLGSQLERGESLAAAALRLGIIEIFPSRDEFERKYPLSLWIATLTPGDTFRVVARSLFLLMSKPETLKTAIERGARVELCLVSPTIDPALIAQCTDMEVSDIQSALNVFKKQVHAWIGAKNPTGSVEVRFHSIPTIDSNLLVGPIAAPRLCIWDLSFGRDVTAKRVFMVDPTKPLGKDIAGRYDAIWSGAKPVYHYDGKALLVNTL
jgi:hypothetical protein